MLGLDGFEFIIILVILAGIGGIISKSLVNADRKAEREYWKDDHEGRIMYRAAKHQDLSMEEDENEEDDKAAE